MQMYPVGATKRDRFILDRRQPRPLQDPWRHQGILVEDERTADGRIARAATVFLTGRECPWRCAMCDLWQYTIAGDTPRGAIPTQVGAARDELRGRPEVISQLKLYNAGSFFDPRALPEEDYDGVAAHIAGLERVVVESHPALVGYRVDLFLEALNRQRAVGTATILEVAIGLETVHPEALDRLNKRMTVDGFALACEQLRGRGASVRAFLLISPPFVPAVQQDDWLQRSIDVAFSCGAWWYRSFRPDRATERWRPWLRKELFGRHGWKTSSAASSRRLPCILIAAGSSSISGTFSAFLPARTVSRRGARAFTRSISSNGCSRGLRVPCVASA